MRQRLCLLLAVRQQPLHNGMVPVLRGCGEKLCDDGARNFEAVAFETLYESLQHGSLPVPCSYRSHVPAAETANAGVGSKQLHAGEVPKLNCR